MCTNGPSWTARQALADPTMPVLQSASVMLTINRAWPTLQTSKIIRPTAGAISRSQIQLHKGFLEGIEGSEEDLCKAVCTIRGASDEFLPVWITGHSLGGACANALVLSLIVIFAEGGIAGFLRPDRLTLQWDFLSLNYHIHPWYITQSFCLHNIRLDGFRAHVCNFQGKAWI